MNRTARQIQTWWILLADPRAREENGGIPIDELAALLAVEARQVVRTIDTLGILSDPDVDPARIQVSIQGDRVVVNRGPELDLGPLRLSPEELLAIDAALVTVLESPIDAGLRSRLETLQTELMGVATPSAGRNRPESPPVAAWPEQLGDGEHLGVLRAGYETCRRVALRYWSEHSQALKDYRIGPTVVLQYRGIWYVIDETGRRFRLDRVRAAELTDEPFDRPIPESVRATGDIFFGATPETLTLRQVGEGREFSWQTASLEGVFAWVRRWGGDYAVAAPAERREEMLGRLHQMRKRYATS